MKISVVIPAYNAEKYLSETIISVIKQTYKAWELIIVNDGSSDSTGSIAAEFASFDTRIHVCHQDNLGVSTARNHGISASDPNTEYLLFLDSDDVLENNALEILASVLAADKTALAVHGLSRFIDSFGEMCQVGIAEEYGRNRKSVSGRTLIAHSTQDATCFSMLVYLNVIHTPGQVLVRRSALDRVGLFDPSVSPTEDWDMWLRITQIGEITLADTVVLNYRRHESNASSKDKTMRGAEMVLRRKLSRNKDLTLLQCQTAVAGYKHSQRYFSWQWLKLAQGRFSKGHLILGAKLLRRASIHFIQSVIGSPV